MRTNRVLASWWRMRRAMHLSSDQMEAARAAQWRRLQPALARTPALAQWAGRALADYPVVDQADVRADYGRWNSLGLGHDALCGMADAAERGAMQGDVAAGWSSGSSGAARGLFVTNTAERADYIGQSLARLLPPSALLRRQRMALHLRASNALYSDVGRRRFSFAHLPLELGTAHTWDRLGGYAPTILVAPPHRLLALAEHGGRLPGLVHLFHGSEPMSEAERAFITDRMAVAPRAIFQATEGFIAAECAHGRLHMNDHAMVIELEPVAGTRGFRPVITDLRRVSQPLVRLRGDDFIEMDDAARCPCGYAGRVIQPVMGRVQDLWRWPGRVLPPSAVVQAVEAELGAGQRWQACASPVVVTLHTAPDCPPMLAGAAAGRLARDLSLPVPVAVRGNLPPWCSPGLPPKRRKVVWNDG